MSETTNNISLVEEKILQKIIFLRNEKVILDIHLAELYEVETRALKQAVKRNIERFPADDFMFELNDNEIDTVVSQFVIPHRRSLGGSMNIAIMRAFVALRKVSHNYQEVMRILSEMRNQYYSRFEELYAALNSLINPPQEPRPRVGFRRNGERD